MKKLITSIFVLGFALYAVSAFAQPMSGMDLSKLSATQKQQLEKAIATQDPETIKETMESFGIKMPSLEMMKERKEQEREDKYEDESKDEDENEDGDDDRKPMFARDGKEHMGMPILTAEQKATLKEVRASGDKEAVASTLKEFGIDMPSKEEMEKKMAERKTQMEAIKAAIDAGDYTAYQAAVAGTVMADKVDSATFETLVKAHDLRAEGDTAGAVALVKGLGMDVMHKEFTKKFVRQNLEAADKELVKQAKELMKSGDAVAAQEIFTSLKDKYEVELAQPIKKFSLFGWLKQKRN